MASSAPFRSVALQLPAHRFALSRSSSSIVRRNFSSSSRRWTVYGFVGLGRMGYAMAGNLRAKIPESDRLLVNDVNEETMKSFVKEVGTAASSHGANGVESVANAREAANRCDVLITCLPDPKTIQACFGNILPKTLSPTPSGEERLFIDTSTIDPLTSRSVAEAIHSTQQGRFVDAPMSGGVVGARAGTLTFMLGASSRTGSLVERTKPILLHMGKRVMHLGGQGAGLAGKLANNYLLAVSNIATAEAMNLGQRLGLDGKVLAELINSSTGRCWSSEVNNPVPGVVETAPSSRDYEGGFGVALMKKDLKLAMTSAQEASVRIELGKEAERIYDEVAEAEPGKDFSVVYKWLSRE